MVIGGVILAGLMKQDIDYAFLALCAFGAVTAFVGLGVMAAIAILIWIGTAIYLRFNNRYEKFDKSVYNRKREAPNRVPLVF